MTDLADTLRTDYGAFFLAQNPAYAYTHFQQEIIAPALEKVVVGQIKRLMLFMPFRASKSELVTCNFVPFYLGHHPNHTVISLSYGHKLAITFGRKVRDYMSRDLYKGLFPNSIIRRDSRAKDDFMTVSGGHYYAAGFDGTINGLGANLLVIDDPIKNRQDALSDVTQARDRDIYAAVMRTRLEPEAAILMVTTRWVPGDLAGWRIQEDGGWDYLNNCPYEEVMPKRDDVHVASDSHTSPS